MSLLLLSPPSLSSSVVVAHRREGYLGFIFGIMHVLIIMVQGSLVFTDAHLNRVWRMVLEAWVFLHATVISTQTLSSNSWPMFCFGFGAIFVISQLPGLPLLRRCHVGVRVIPAVVFAAVYVACFVLIEAWTSIVVVVFIPAAIYLGAIGLNLAVMVALVVGRAACKTRCSGGAGERPASTLASFAGFTFLAVFFISAVIACSVVAENLLDRESTVATALVYGSMCLGVLCMLLSLMCALPRPPHEQRREGCMQCCCWKRPVCCVRGLPCCHGDNEAEAEAASNTNGSSSSSSQVHDVTAYDRPGSAAEGSGKPTVELTVAGVAGKSSSSDDESSDPAVAKAVATQ